MRNNLKALFIDLDNAFFVVRLASPVFDDWVTIHSQL